VLVTPPVLVYAYRGMTRIGPESLELTASYEASRWQTFHLLRLPGAVPEIFVALKYTSVLTLVGVVLCEVIRARDGLGYEIQLSLNAFATGRAWGAVLLLALGGIVLYFVVATVERRLFPWSAHDRAT
jgi:NitT/TauT family transport system permease protein